MTSPQSSKYVKDIASLVAIALLAAMVVFTALPQTTEFWHVLHKTGHPLAFGLTALLVLRLLTKFNRDAASPVWMPYVAAFLITVVLGAMTEIAQLFTHRNARVADVVSDAVGTLACLAGYAAFSLGRQSTKSTGLRLGLWLVAVFASIAAMAPLLWCLAAYTVRDAAFPMILHNPSRLGLYFISQEAGNVSVMPLPQDASQNVDGRVLRIAIDRGSYPGVHFTEPYPRWSKYQSLLMEVTNPGDTTLKMVVRVHDRQHNHDYNDRFNRDFAMAPKSKTTIKVSLQDIQRGSKRRLLNLDAIGGLMIFSLGAVPNGEFLISKVWLE